METPVPRLSVLLLLLAALPANAQSPAQSLPAHRARTAPSVAAPVTTVVPRATTTVQQTKPIATASKQVIPANLLSVEDRAIIFVGGKPMAAGDVKRQLVAEMRQLSGSAQFTRGPRVAKIPQGAQVRDVDGPGGGFAGRIGGVGRRPSDRVDATRTPSVLAKPGVHDAITLEPALSYTAQRDYCRTHTAEITRVRGTITPNARFTIEGACFGDQTGSVEAIGQFPGGNMRLVFERWTDSEILAFVPPVTGADDHSVALTVVRLDKKRSPAAQARFVAARTQVEVPARYWTPNPDFVQIAVDQGGGNIFTGFTVWGAGGESRSTPFSLLINRACWLDSYGWNTRAGSVHTLSGWENGPPHEAKVDVAWTPRCTTQTSNYIVASSSQRICSIDFSLTAWASCPAGLAP